MQTFAELCGVLGLYFHVPFCRKACTYCNFHFSTSLNGKFDMVKSMINELRILTQNSNIYAQFPLETIYFGGGTPSLLDYEELQNILHEVEKIWNISTQKLAEVTLECNPEDLSPEKVKDWKKLGINRLSIGIQSLSDNELRLMNRQHTAEQSKQCVQLALDAGIEHISIDLIYGTPWKSDEAWERELDWALNSGINHLSCYALTVEEKTLLASQIKRNQQPAPPEEKMVKHFEILQSKIEQFGWDDYEISNFCKPGHRAIHNGNYWKRKAYLGIGPSAHSYDGTNTRTWNIANNAEYMRRIENQSIWYESEVLSDRDIFNEKIMTGLRTKDGILHDIFSSLNPKNQRIIENKIKEFYHTGYIDLSGNRIYLTDSGRLISDFIISELMIIE